MPQMPDDVLLQVNNLRKYFPIESGWLRRRVVGYVKAVDDVSFSIRKGQTLGLVGESGCGKTTTARSIIRAYEPTSGEVLFRTRKGIVNMSKLDKAGLKLAREDMQMIFQDPYSSLNPRMPVLDIVAEPLVAYGYRKKEREERVRDLLEMVGLRPEYMRRFPHSFSGGQRQRIGVARALALNPSLVIADEAVSALDVSVQAQVLNLLLDLQQQLKLTYLFIGHDLSVVRYLCDQVAVMYLGRIVEIADVDLLYATPKHPYTSALLSSVPDANPHSKWEAQPIEGEISDSAHQKAGCNFAPRCKYADKLCTEKVPQPKSLVKPGSGETHQVVCHYADSLELAGVS